MSGPSFEGPVEARHLLVGNSASHGGTFNVNYYCSEAKSDGNEKDTDFNLTADLSQVTEVAHFVAREEELTQMRETLRNAPTRRTAIVHGLGGIGKTQLTIEYIKRNYNDYSAIIWLNAKDEASLKESFARAARSIVLQYPSLIYMKDTEESPDLDRLVRAVNRWLSEPKNNKWLVVYDNYDFPKLDRRDESENIEVSGDIVDERSAAEKEIIVTKAFDIRPFFPAAFHGAIIVTTRSSAVKIGRLVHLQKFKDIKDSLEILASTSQRQDTHNNSAAAQLARKLDGLPLALSTAGAYLEEVSTSWEEYFGLYQKSWLQLQRASPKLLTYENRAMYSTWDISYQHIKQKNKAAAMLLKLWAYFDNEDLWYELLQQNRSDTDGWLEKLMQDRLLFDEAMRVLRSHGLVEIGSGGYSIHGCIHAWIVYALNPTLDTEMAWLAIRCVASSVLGNTEPEYWFIHRRLLRHAERCFETIVADSELQEGDEWVPHQFAMLFKDQGQLGYAETMYDRALRGYEKAWGPEHTSTLSTVNNLANLYKNQGRFGDAEAMYDRALQGYEKALGSPMVETYPPALITMENLGDLLCTLNRLEEAQLYYTRAKAGLRTVHGSQSEKYQRVISKLQTQTKLLSEIKPASSSRKYFQLHKLSDWFTSAFNRMFLMDKP